MIKRGILAINVKLCLTSQKISFEILSPNSLINSRRISSIFTLLIKNEPPRLFAALGRRCSCCSRRNIGRCRTPSC
jgi:hypothetical protein